MKKIQLTQGKFALVDDTDFEWLNQWKWYLSHGYAVRHLPRMIQKNRKVTYMHRIINNTSEGMETDHINQNKLDNRRENLRTVTKYQNSLNRSLNKNSTSGIKGVSWHKTNKKWMVYVYQKGRQIRLGFFSNINKAILARLKGEQKYYASI